MVVGVPVGGLFQWMVALWDDVIVVSGCCLLCVSVKWAQETRSVMG